MKFKEENLAAKAERDARIVAQDLFNSYACTYDPVAKAAIDRSLRGAFARLSERTSKKRPIKLWVDGSYNPKTKTAGIGIVIIADEDLPIGEGRNVAFGKAVKAKDSQAAEIYALSIGMSYILDTFQDADSVMIRYDCVSSTVCATNIDAYTSFGAPYTNFKSALKRAKRRRMNMLFEHTDAHADDRNNNLCDAIAKYHAKIKLQAPVLKQVRKFMKK